MVLWAMMLMIMMTLKTVKNTNYNDDAMIMKMMMRRKKTWVVQQYTSRNVLENDKDVQHNNSDTDQFSVTLKHHFQ